MKDFFMNVLELGVDILGVVINVLWFTFIIFSFVMITHNISVNVKSNDNNQTITKSD